MNFGPAIGSGFKKYIVFRGRSSRSEFWYWALFVNFASLVTVILDWILFPARVVGPVAILFALVVILPEISLSIRRLHDIDKSGWWMVLGLAPVVGWIILIVWAIRKGDAIRNRFGPDPSDISTI